MSKNQKNEIGKIRAAAIVLFFCFALGGFFYPREISKTFGSDFQATSTPRSKQPAQQQTDDSKFAKFSHSARRHSKLACGSCHKFPSANWKSARKKSEAFPDVTDYPKHESCLSCHRQEFFGSPKPNICSICHVNPNPRGGARQPFPNPREIFDKTAKGKQHVSDFAISFPHDKHIEIVSQNAVQDGEIITAKFSAKQSSSGEKSCAVCHQTYQPQGASDDEFVIKPPAKPGDRFWLKKGTFKTSPIGHAKCFECHSPDSGIAPAPTDYATCHKLAPKMPATDFDAKFAAAAGDLDKITLTSWRKRDSSATFRHEFSSHADLECAACHNGAAIDTIDFLTKKVPVASCSLCHITETSEDGGILNFEVDSKKKDAKFECAKCHIAFGKMPVPESHIKAIAAAGK